MPVAQYEGVDVLDVNATFGEDFDNLLLDSLGRNLGVEHCNNGGWMVVPILPGSKVELYLLSRFDMPGMGRICWRVEPFVSLYERFC